MRTLADGNLDFLGRVDFQIKLNGQRVEVGEIEAMLKQGGASDALVLCRRSEEGVQRLVAYVLPASVDVEGVLEVSRQHLPSFMVPSARSATRRWRTPDFCASACSRSTARRTPIPSSHVPSHASSSTSMRPGRHVHKETRASNGSRGLWRLSTPRSPTCSACRVSRLRHAS